MERDRLPHFAGSILRLHLRERFIKAHVLLEGGIERVDPVGGDCPCEQWLHQRLGQTHVRMQRAEAEPAKQTQTQPW
jgi:hypothetical protein